MTVPRTIEWVSATDQEPLPGYVRMIDQTLLPTTVRFLETDDLNEIWQAIKMLKVRGAPAIGIAAAMGVAAHVQKIQGNNDALYAAVKSASSHLASSRPTAVNLFWALERMQAVAEQSMDLAPEAFKRRLIKEATLIRDEDAAMCRAIGTHGARFLNDDCTVLTHCNAGGLATAEFGTALAPIYTMAQQGRTIHVYADETRPLLQGARLTVWELMQANIDVTLICDNMAAQVMKEGRIDAVLVGSDRIAANGDAANKIGTYGVALAAKAHDIPFYVLAPSSTIDSHTATGAGIPIEERASDEITCGFGKQTAPTGAKVYAPAFDVTPYALITAIITENGVFTPTEKQH